MPINFADHPPDPYVEYVFMRQEIDEVWQDNGQLIEYLLHPRLGHTIALLGGISTYRVTSAETHEESETTREVYLERTLSPEPGGGLRQEFWHSGHPARDYSSTEYKPSASAKEAVAIARDRLVLGRTIFDERSTQKAVSRRQRIIRRGSEAPQQWPTTFEGVIVPGFEELLRDPPERYLD